MYRFVRRQNDQEIQNELKSLVSSMQGTLAEMNGHFDTFYSKLTPQNRTAILENFKKNKILIDNMKQMFVGDFFKFLSEQDKKQSRGTR